MSVPTRPGPARALYIGWYVKSATTVIPTLTGNTSTATWPWHILRDIYGRHRSGCQTGRYTGRLKVTS